MSRPGLVSELRRRKVFRVAGVYLIVAWILLQVVATTAPMLRLPEWAPTLVLVLLLVGLPIALVLAWAFDVTPEGLRRAESPAAPLASRSGRAAGYLGFGVLVIVLAVAAAATFRPESARGGPDEPTERSIAVLPFANVSGVEENEYFSDGITEDILTRLAVLEDLRVISRTSVMTYKGSDKTVPEIAAELGVRYVLEGSVRRVGERVRITGQLIDARADGHLWAESYDRDLTDIFAVQGEIAAEIAGALAVELSPEQERRLGRGATTSPVAYELYLKGREAMRSGWQRPLEEWGDAVASAATLFRQAIAEDSAFAPAHVGLSEAYLNHFEFGDQVIFDSALAHVRRAIEIDPELPDAYVQRARLYFHHYQDAASKHAAYDNYRTALRLNPNHADAYTGLARLVELNGDVLDALRYYKQATMVDPTNVDAWPWLGGKYEHHGYFQEAEAAYRRGARGPGALRCKLAGLALSAGDTTAARQHLREMLASAPFADREFCAYQINHRIGEFRTAEEYLRGYISEIPVAYRTSWAPSLAFLAHENGKLEESERLLGEAEAAIRADIEEDPERSWLFADVARIQVLRGEYDEAVANLEAAERLRPGLTFPDLSDAEFAPLRGHRGFEALRARLEAERDSIRAEIEREGLHR